MAIEIINNPFEASDLSALNTIHRTYRMDFENKRIVGMIDNLDASRQAIEKAMMTKRFAYQIYDDQYGCDIANKIGNSSLSAEYMDSDIPAMIEDMLLVEDTSVGLADLEYEIIDGDGVYIKAFIDTIYGGTSIGALIEQPSGGGSSSYTGEYRDLVIRNGRLYAQHARVAIYLQGSLTMEIRDGQLYAVYDGIDEPELEMRDGMLYVNYG